MTTFDESKFQKPSRRDIGVGAGLASLALGLAVTAGGGARADSKGKGILRTPDARFQNLPEYDFEPNYIEIPYGASGTPRVHYIDEGDTNAPVVLCFHGQGSWAYIYRRAIPKLVDAGLRVVAPDFIGFGRSDKLASVEDYSFKAHVEWIKTFVREMDFQDVTPIMFDWGGFFGLRVAGENPELFDRIVLSNTQLPTLVDGESEWFNRFRATVLGMKSFPMGKMVAGGVTNKIGPEIIDAYDAPFPDESYKTGPRAFPMIHPITEYDAPIAANRAAWEALAEFQKPVLTVFADSTASSAMPPEMAQNHIPGAQGQNHVIIENAGFYVVEDAPVQIADAVADFIKSNKS